MAEPSNEQKSTQATITQAIVDGISQGMTQLAQSLKPQGPLEMAGFSAERVAEITQLPDPQNYRDIPWVSPDTGATAIAHVVASKKFPNGRITFLTNYTHPREAYVYEAEGGKVPDGFPMWKQNAPSNLPKDEEPLPGLFNMGFLQWRWVNYYQADIRHFVGKEIKAHCCASPDGLKTPWIEGKVGSNVTE